MGVFIQIATATAMVQVKKVAAMEKATGTAMEPPLFLKYHYPLVELELLLQVLLLLRLQGVLQLHQGGKVAAIPIVRQLAMAVVEMEAVIMCFLQLLEMGPLAVGAIKMETGAVLTAVEPTVAVVMDEAIMLLLQLQHPLWMLPPLLLIKEHSRRSMLTAAGLMFMAIAIVTALKLEALQNIITTINTTIMQVEHVCLYVTVLM